MSMGNEQTRCYHQVYLREDIEKAHTRQAGNGQGQRKDRGRLTGVSKSCLIVGQRDKPTFTQKVSPLSQTKE